MIRDFLVVSRFLWRTTHGQIAWVILLSLITAATEGVSIMMLIPIVAIASPDSSARAGDIPLIGDLLVRLSTSLPILLAIFVLLVAFQSLLNYAKNVFALTLMQIASDRLKHDLFKAVSAARWDVIAKRRLSDINQALISGIPRCMTAANAALMLMQGMLLIGIYIVVAALLSWQMALFAAMVGGGLLAVMYPIRRRASRFGQDLTGLFEQQSHTTLEFLNGIRLAKTFLAEGRFVRSFDRHLVEIRTNTLRFFTTNAVGTLIFQLGVAVIAALFVYLAMVHFALGLGEVAVLLLIFARLTPRFNALQEQSQSFLSNAPAYGHYTDMLRYFASGREADVGASEPPRLTRMIELRDLTMQFDADAPPSLNRINVQIEAGRVTALVGASGSGKSTLADIVTGLITPTSGQLLIDDVAIDQSNRRAWRSRVATVPQDALLFNATLRENLALGRPGASEADLWQALERAQIADFIRALPDALDTQVGDRGTRFSGGERQRVALARALLSRPEILILDEATSALDIDNQQRVAAAIAGLRDGRLTILLIAHQPMITNIADVRIMLEHGMVVTGTDSLLPDG
ncbi:ABC transporter ATP-binding protein [Sphingomonas qomolangmaensis]|uniref:ABC transporter ATP-binding protein/permease n=1 Tax=Sphingomonas qomolangmaensis TaxID=2918765 RepID=A0ABY5L947_9SPHN|nr:ABC transporter ATP-binding protein [Sphingomonas qomolangmaensis]UUL82382.1 ABC transporter ATP-binding protein/permease [Sphingomonas qomolangmaensis]